MSILYHTISFYASFRCYKIVEYDFSKLFSALSDALLLPVIYSEKRPLLNLNNICDSDCKVINPGKFMNELPNIIRSMITKSIEWERENEWRIVSLSINVNS